MKKIMFFLAVLLIGGWSYAQDEGDLTSFDAGGGDGGDGSSFFSFTIGKPFNSSGTGVSELPTVQTSVGVTKGGAQISLDMGILFPLSPVPNDSLFILGDDLKWYYNKKKYTKSAFLALAVGFYNEGETLSVGASVRFGADFVERENHLYAFSILGVRMEAGYKIMEGFHAFISNDFNFLISEARLRSNALPINPGIGARISVF